ncbi:hypothetical protein CEUSTIGMA_g10400.t1 [Chlamydomonas eustigma]|uniref:Uncharacterized protein n=1 Tax=Chlamydomonas eustigma TaxID=1157962 RepID=A0A250XIV7_9CHLO|nr:hypothetical protein CEUSTIGMA_g10400.t1 [Chlamydomonas eustigma]|eukprot:GAX82973.1 hypothetical protein CEUSTIGMA_g10400.t1 [Chlamydomonas eustigma]
MNRRLLDPFQSVELPEIVEEYLSNGLATAAAFNRRGTLLATGTADGSIVIWDFGTKGVAKSLNEHSSTVSSVCWSRDGRFLVSGSEDQRIIMWDVLTGNQEKCIALDHPVSSLSLTRQPPYQCIVNFSDGSTALKIDFSTGDQKQLPTFGEGEGLPGSTAILNPKHGDIIILGQSRGSFLAMIDLTTLLCLDIIKLPNNARVNGLTLNRKGNLLLVNCHDRILRMFELYVRSTLPSSAQCGLDTHLVTEHMSSIMSSASAGSKAVMTSLLLVPNPEAQPSTVDNNNNNVPSSSSTTPLGLFHHLRDFQNVVERCSWRSCCFSSDSEHVIGASASKAEHQLYIWNRIHGNMERILEGPKEGSSVVLWHPVRSVLLSVTGAGRVLCWARIYSENWSAFAPDFLELEENVEYVEREDEFDWNTEQAAAGTTQAESTQAMDVDSASAGVQTSEVGGEDEEDEEVEVDILTREENKVLSSEDEDELPGQLHYLPAVIEEDVHVDGDKSRIEAADGKTSAEQAGEDPKGVTGKKLEALGAMPSKEHGGGRGRPGRPKRADLLARSEEGDTTGPPLKVARQ